MEPLFSNVAVKPRLPLINLKEVTSKDNLLKKLPIYLPNDVLTNLQLCTDTLNSTYDGKVSSLWTSSKQREKFKHISNNPICICGAGNGLSFLYDTLPENVAENRIEPIINGKKGRNKKIEDKTGFQRKKIIKIPEIILAPEFTLSIHHGTKPIQFDDETFSTKAINHNNHKISLPLMIPNINTKSNNIYHSLNDILQKSGLNDPLESDLPTSLHKLLLIGKKEQDLYNVIFHEVIKETTIDCFERGELLSNIRQRYRNVFVKVPEIVKDFHNKVVAQRILDRRLTEELMRFQNTVSLLSSELSGIEAHENKINQVCQRAAHQLRETVEETKTNTDLLTEYHDLYEKQRLRLEKSVAQLEIERDCWRTAVYKITELVLDHYNIQSGIDLVEYESNITVLSQYFVDLLAVTDNKALEIIKNTTSLWCSEAQKFSLMLAIREDSLKSSMHKKIQQIQLFKEDFEDEYIDDKGKLVQTLGMKDTQKILNLIIVWEKFASDTNEMFGGQNMLNEEEKLKYMKFLCSEFTDVAVEVSNRHRNETDGSFNDDHLLLLENNKSIDRMIEQFMHQLIGENGVADGIVTLQTHLENWINRLSNCITELVFRPIEDSEWIKFKLLLDDWISLLQQSSTAVGSVKIRPNDEMSNRKVGVHDIIQSVDNWSHKTCSGTESDNLKLREAIVNLNKNMVRWTSQIVLRLAPDLSSNSAEAKRAARIASADFKELEERVFIMHDKLNKFTNYIFSCSKDIISKSSQMKTDIHSMTSDENIKLQQLKEASKSWIEKSKEILVNVMEIENLSQTVRVNNTDSSAHLNTSEDHINDDNKNASDEEDNSETIIEDEEDLVQSETKDIIDEAEDTNVNVDEPILSQSPNKDLPILNEDNNEADDEENIKPFSDEFANNDLIKDLDEDEPNIEIPQVAPTVEGVGDDSNVHSKYLIQDPEKPYLGSQFRGVNNINLSVDLPKTTEAFQLIQIFEILQNNLRSLNSECLKAENEQEIMELEVAKSKVYLETLEKTFDNLNKELHQMETEKTETLATPVLFSVTSTVVEKQLTQSTDKSSTPKSVVSHKRRTLPHKKAIQKK